MSRRPIVVGIDGSVGAYAAELWALQECHIQSRPLVLLHCVEPGRTGDDLAAAQSEDEARVAVGERVLAEAATVASREQPSVLVTSRLVRTAAADALVQESAEAELLVIAIRGDGKDVSGMFGSLSQRVAVHAQCPVAVVPANPSVPVAQGSPARVVVGISSTSAGRLALELAFKQASYRGAELVCVRAWGGTGSDEALDDTPGAPSGGPDPDELLLGHFAALRAQYPNVEVQQDLVPGEPVEALLAAARDAQLLVVGCFHSNETWTSRLGPVPAALLRRASCPILIVGKGHHGDHPGPDTSETVIDEVVVGVDGSPASMRALAWAASEAERKGARLVIAHATDTYVREALSAATVVTVLRESASYGLELARAASAEIVRTHPQLESSTVLREEKPADLLLALGGARVLTVVGNRGEGRFAGALLGSVSQRVAAHAVGPVAVINDDESTGAALGRVVVGISASPGGRRALRFACREASERNATLIAVRAYGVFGRSAHAQLYGPLLGLGPGEELILQDAVKDVQEDFPNLTIEPHLVEEPVHDALHQACLKADLLVLGCHHEDTHWPSRLGAVASLMLHRSPCPVVVVGISHSVGAAQS